MKFIYSILNTLKDKYFWISLIIAGLLLFITALVVLYSLKVVTKWGQSSIVPNIINKSIDDAENSLYDAELFYEVKDTVFRKDLPNNTVIDAQPQVGLDIKRGRTIYLIVSTKRPTMVEMPNLVGRSSLRFAKIELESRGLLVGNLSYVPSTEKDAVLEQKIGNTLIKAGTRLPKGTPIDLVLGDGLTGIAVTPPLLIGKTYSQIQSILDMKNLFGNFYFSEDVTDSSSAYVYRQYPSPLTGEKLNVGEPMDIFLGLKVPENILNDSAFKAQNEIESD